MASDTEERARSVFSQENACHGGKKQKKKGKKKTYITPAGPFTQGGDPEVNCGVHDGVFLRFVGLFPPPPPITGALGNKFSGWVNIKGRSPVSAWHERNVRKSFPAFQSGIVPPLCSVEEKLAQ